MKNGDKGKCIHGYKDPNNPMTGLTEGVEYEILKIGPMIDKSGQMCIKLIVCPVGEPAKANGPWNPYRFDFTQNATDLSSGPSSGDEEESPVQGMPVLKTSKGSH